MTCERCKVELVLPEPDGQRDSCRVQCTCEHCGHRQIVEASGSQLALAVRWMRQLGRIS